MKNKSLIAGIACQIAYEYPNWTDEHVGEMLRISDDIPEPRPCSYDTLCDATAKADECKKNGLSWDKTLKEVKKFLATF